MAADAKNGRYVAASSDRDVTGGQPLVGILKTLGTELFRGHLGWNQSGVSAAGVAGMVKRKLWGRRRGDCQLPAAAHAFPEYSGKSRAALCAGMLSGAAGSGRRSLFTA